MREEYDLVVIGTGEAGGAPIRKCREAGWSVAVIDDHPFGGTCALRGCDPKKVLVGAAELVDWQRRMGGFGITGDAAVKWAELMAFKSSFTEPVPAAREAGLAKIGATSAHGEARFIAADRLQVGDRELQFRYVVLATGATPRRLGIPGEEHVISSTQFLELERLPERIAFIGAGYVSFEFAHVAHVCGADVTILGRGQPLRSFDASLVAALLDDSRSRGIAIRMDSEVTSVERRGDSNGFRVEAMHDGSQSTCEVDLVVHGAGRVPHTARLDISAGNIRVDARGGVVVNDFLQSVSNARVYAAGDVTMPKGSLPLTPVAAHEGAIVASNLLRGNHKRPDYRGVPSVVFTLPPLAAVGFTETAAREAGLDVRVKCEDTARWYSNRRVRQPLGMFKTIVENGTDRIVGAHLLGERADEVINVFALAVRFGIGARELRQMMYAYPTSGSDVPDMI
jgi:glutathione reductase (NADPH)